jgi:hypothetical protein
MQATSVLAVAACAACAFPAASWAAPTLIADRVVIVGRADADAAWTDAPTEALAGAGAELAVVVVGHEGKRRVVIADDEVAPLRIGGRAVRAKERRAPATLGTPKIRWSVVEPHGFRTREASNGATSRFYSNVSTSGSNFGEWLGYDTIEYSERVVHDWSDAATARRIDAEVSSGEAGAIQIAGLGTVRFKVEVDLGDGDILASPGADAVDRHGILPSVHRVSIRRGDDFLGWLTGYLLVPEVFGSAGGGKNHQTERFTGADCADIMVGAMRRSGRADVKYTNVAGLTTHATEVAPAVDLDEHGNPPSAITGVQVGDLIRIDYGGSLRGHTPRGWDHVASLFEDRSDPDGPDQGAANGQLDGFDLVIHMGHPRLVIEPLSGQSPATIDVLRWRER